MKNKRTIQATFGLRILFVFICVLILGTLIVVFTGQREGEEAWKQYQAEYNKRYTAKLSEKIKEAEKAGDKKALQKWEKLKRDHLNRQDIKIREISLPDAGVRNLCKTCHVAIGNSLFAKAKNPLKAHPIEILEHHKISRYGCTPCHHGQGFALEKDKAHGKEENWELPKLPGKYLQSACFECHETVYGLKGAEKAAAGKKLFMEMGCYGCHDANIISDLPKFSMPFSGMSKKIKNKKWVFRWLEDPLKTRPGTLMPNFRINDEQIDNITAYIYDLDDRELELDTYPPGSGSIRKGKALFTDKGCIACHSPDREKQGLTRRVPMLSDAGLKLELNWMYTWIDDPRSVNPDTWMPDVELEKGDLKHLTAYLAWLKDDTVEERMVACDSISGNKEEGKALVQSLGCLGCHKIKGQDDPSKVGVSVADVADKRMEELPFGNSEVKETKWDWIYNKINDPDIYQTEDMPMYMPDHQLSDKEIERFTVFYLYNRLLDLPEKYIVRASDIKRTNERGDWMIRHFNCRGCHQILEKDEDPRVADKIEKKTFVPPEIVDEVEKVQPDWLFEYLEEPTNLRPWLNIRMPNFGFNYQQLQVLIEHLHDLMPEKKQEICKIPYASQPDRADYADKTIEMGKYRFRNDKCMQCHPVNFTGEPPEGKKLEDLSIDLMLTKDRLRFRWIKDFMRNPDKYAGSETKMPFVFYTPDRVPRIPDPEKWLQRTALFLMFMDEVPEPVKQEEKERETKSFDFSNY